jgi:hypothetical protein
MAREILSKRNLFDFESPDSAISRFPSKNCFYGYKNVFISNSWPVTNKVLLIELKIRVTFKYTGYAIFLSQKNITVPKKLYVAI